MEVGISSKPICVKILRNWLRTCATKAGPKGQGQSPGAGQAHHPTPAFGPSAVHLNRPSNQPLLIALCLTKARTPLQALTDASHPLLPAASMPAYKSAPLIPLRAPGKPRCADRTLSRGCRWPPRVGWPRALKLYALNSSVRQVPLHGCHRCMGVHRCMGGKVSLPINTRMMRVQEVTCEAPCHMLDSSECQLPLRYEQCIKG